jgi:hypothetical protein
VSEHRPERDEFMSAASEYCDLCEKAVELGRERLPLRVVHYYVALYLAG